MVTTLRINHNPMQYASFFSAIPFAKIMGHFGIPKKKVGLWAFDILPSSIIHFNLGYQAMAQECLKESGR